MTDIDTILAKCTPEGDCLLWNGSVNDFGLPCNSRGRRSLRRLVYEHFAGPLSNERRVGMRCNERRCLQFEHMEAMTISALLSKTNKNRKLSPIQIANMTRARRARSEIDMARALAVRLDLAAGLSTRAAAKKHGISQSMASVIGRRKAWRESLCPNNSVFNMRVKP